MRLICDTHRTLWHLPLALLLDRRFCIGGLPALTAPAASRIQNLLLLLFSLSARSETNFSQIGTKVATFCDQLSLQYTCTSWSLCPRPEPPHSAHGFTLGGPSVPGAPPGKLGLGSPNLLLAETTTHAPAANVQSANTLSVLNVDIFTTRRELTL